jgi:hypothetical protein
VKFEHPGRCLLPAHRQAASRRKRRDGRVLPSPFVSPHFLDAANAFGIPGFDDPCSTSLAMLIAD